MKIDKIELEDSTKVTYELTLTDATQYDIHMLYILLENLKKESSPKEEQK